MDKEFIKENNLTEDIERFRQLSEYKYPKQSLKKLYEYTFITAPQVNEDGEEDDAPQQPAPQDGNAPQQPDMQGQGGEPAPQPEGGMPQDGGQIPDAAPNGEMPQDMPPADAQGGETTDMEAPEVEDDGIETTEMEPDDEVIDVDELTQSQEATEYKLDGVDDRLAKIFAVVQKFSDQLEKNEQNIMALKDEFEKRNPTEEERLNLRSQSSYPYCETPKDYWDEKAKQNPNYDVMYDNEVSPAEEQEKFEIRKGDISGLNMKSISDTLNVNQDLKKYIGF